MHHLIFSIELWVSYYRFWFLLALGSVFWFLAYYLYLGNQLHEAIKRRSQRNWSVDMLRRKAHDRVIWLPQNKTKQPPPPPPSADQAGGKPVFEYKLVAKPPANQPPKAD